MGKQSVQIKASPTANSPTTNNAWNTLELISVLHGEKLASNRWSPVTCVADQKSDGIQAMTV